MYVIGSLVERERHPGRGKKDSGERTDAGKAGHPTEGAESRDIRSMNISVKRLYIVPFPGLHYVYSAMLSANPACFNFAVIVLQQTSLSAVGNVGVIFQQFNAAQVSDIELVIATCVMVLQFRKE